MKNIYPLTIIKDRYNGVYSGGNFTAWNMYYYDIPTNPALGDITCLEFWNNTSIPVGRGVTPDEAVKDLQKRLEALKDGKAD